MASKNWVYTGSGNGLFPLSATYNQIGKNKVDCYWFQAANDKCHKLLPREITLFAWTQQVLVIFMEYTKFGNFSQK